MVKLKKVNDTHEMGKVGVIICSQESVKLINNNNIKIRKNQIETMKQ